MSRNSMYAKFITVTNQSTWECIEPVLNIPYARPVRTLKKEEQEERVLKKKFVEKKSGRKEQFQREQIKNTQFSFTSFLIPLYITGHKQDYQLLYCVSALKNGLKTISTTLRKEGFAQLYMVGMKSEIDWEQIKQNNVTFTDIIIGFLIKSGTVCMVAGNKKEVITKVHNTDAPFVVLLTAADIQMPCQAKVCVGSSWMIFRRSVESRKNLFDREVFNCGRRALHSGLLINGCNTIMACAFKELEGVHYFIFDLTTGDFALYDDGCFIRDYGNLLCLNEGLFYKFKTKVQDWLMEKKLNKEKLEYCSRYTGGWVSDGYRVIRSGGLLLSPEDSETNEGRVKFLCKAVPLAYLAEKAGGKASNGQLYILKMKSTRITNTTLVLGSLREVDNYLTNCCPQVDNESLLSQSESDDTSTDLD